MTYFRTEKVLLRRQGEGRLVYKSSCVSAANTQNLGANDVPFSYPHHIKIKTLFILN